MSGPGPSENYFHILDCTSDAMQTRNLLFQKTKWKLDTMQTDGSNAPR